MSQLYSRLQADHDVRDMQWGCFPFSGLWKRHQTVVASQTPWRVLSHFCNFPQQKHLISCDHYSVLCLQGKSLVFLAS